MKVVCVQTSPRSLSLTRNPLADGPMVCRAHFRQQEMRTDHTQYSLAMPDSPANQLRPLPQRTHPHSVRCAPVAAGAVGILCLGADATLPVAVRVCCTRLQPACAHHTVAPTRGCPVPDRTAPLWQHMRCVQAPAWHTDTWHAPAGQQVRMRWWMAHAMHAVARQACQSRGQLNLPRELCTHAWVCDRLQTRSPDTPHTVPARTETAETTGLIELRRSHRLQKGPATCVCVGGGGAALPHRHVRWHAFKSSQEHSSHHTTHTRRATRQGVAQGEKACASSKAAALT
jgi:hypothetical protein